MTVSRTVPDRIRDFAEAVKVLPTRIAKARLQEIVSAIYVWRDRLEVEFR